MEPRPPPDMGSPGVQLGSAEPVDCIEADGRLDPKSTSTSSNLDDKLVGYTPVTGRISRAKKGVPIHVCEVCRPVKTFARAEHLRRHQLSHQKPQYPCTFEDCERAFHRPDLLARHMQRHETQGEKPYKSSLSPSFNTTRNGFQETDHRSDFTDDESHEFQAAAMDFKWVPTSAFSASDIPAVTQPLLPLLKVPEEDWVPGLSYNNSPWCSSASNSTYSSLSSEVSERTTSGFTVIPSMRHHDRGTLIDIPPSYGYFFLDTVKADRAALSGLAELPEEEYLAIHESSTDNDKVCQTKWDLDVPMLGCSRLMKGLADVKSDHIAEMPCSVPEQQIVTFGRDRGSEMLLKSTRQDGKTKDVKDPRDDHILEARDLQDALASDDNDMDMKEIFTESIPQTTKFVASPPPGSHQRRPSSAGSLSEGISVAFETDSADSGDETDMEEDESLTMPCKSDVLRLIQTARQHNSTLESDAVLETILTPAMKSLVDSLMTEFWDIFNQEWSANLRKCTGTPSSSSSSTSTSHPTTSVSQSQPSGTSSEKRQRCADDHPDNEEPNNPKRYKPSSNPSEMDESTTKFACPYRKHNPRKYSHATKTWRSCALSSFNTVARVKGHLYRHHRIFQCARCNALFPGKVDLQAHHMAIKACEVVHSQPHDGITCALEVQLKSRKKGAGNETQEERWKSIYAILFPMEAIPSPYFEPIQEDMPQSPNTTDLTSYEEFSRQELPRLFRGALETAIASEKQLAEDRLRNRLVSMIQECQDRVFSLYRSQHEDGIGMSSPISPRSATGTGVTGLGILQSSFQSPPYQVTNCMTFGILDEDDRKSVMPPMEPRTSDLDSGYFSIGLDLNHLVSGNTSKETSELPPWRIELMHGFCDTNLEDSAQSIDCFDDFLVSGGDSSSLSANDDYAFLENGFGDMNSMESNDNVQYDPLAYFPGIQEATER